MVLLEQKYLEKHMKLLLENWRQYLEEQNTPVAQNYSSVNIDNDAVQLLLSKAKEHVGEIPEGFKDKEGKWPHHMTINMGPLLQGWEEGSELVLEIDGWGIINDESGQAMAFRVNKTKLPAPTKNAAPHITTLVGPGGKPFHSNKIVNWEPIESFGVKGTVVAAAQQKKKEKPKKQQKPQGQANPVEFAKSLAARGLPADKIKNIIMNKFNKPEAAALGIMRGAGIQ